MSPHDLFSLWFLVLPTISLCLAVGLSVPRRSSMCKVYAKGIIVLGTILWSEMAHVSPSNRHKWTPRSCERIFYYYKNDAGREDVSDRFDRSKHTMTQIGPQQQLLVETNAWLGSLMPRNINNLPTFLSTSSNSTNHSLVAFLHYLNRLIISFVCPYRPWISHN
jgi:hypothetical protein